MLRIIWSVQEQDGFQIAVLCSIAGIPPFLLDATGTLVRQFQWLIILLQSFVDYDDMTEKKLLKMIEVYRMVVVFPILVRQSSVFNKPIFRPYWWHLLLLIITTG